MSTDRIALALVLVAFPATLLAAAKFPKPDRIPAMLTAEEKAVVAEGIALHDARDFDGAITKYRKVLDHSPSAVAVMHELALSYFAKKDYANALEMARLGIQFKSPILPHFYVTIGSCLDELGKRAEAIETYKAGIKVAPDTALLYFNLGLSEMRSGNHADAKKALQQSVVLNPNHASSHFLLGSAYQQLGYRIPAVLALSRFLLLEPGSSRAGDAIAVVNRVVGASVRKGEKENHINITLAVSPKNRQDEGDFDPVDLAMSLSLAANQMEDAKKRLPQFRQVAMTFSLMSECMSRMKRKGFAATYYAPFFVELGQREFNEAFVYRGFAAAKITGSEEWAKDNEAKLHEFDAWLASYKWAAKN